MRSGKPNDRAVFWTSIGLTVLVCVIFIPLAPIIWTGVLQAALGTVFSLLDVREWSRLTWFIVNFAVLALLMGFRFGPNLKRAWKARRAKASETT
jgi:hypothetical protein